MFSNKSKQAILAAVLWFLATGRSDAQAPLGSRAQGMAGAFVGVADDATAVYWNPAGLATATFISFVLDYGQAETVPNAGLSSEGARRQTGGIMAVSAPPVGFGYYRLTDYVAGPREAAVPGVPGREEVRRSVYALRTSVLGVTLLQSIGDYVVVGGNAEVDAWRRGAGHVVGGAPRGGPGRGRGSGGPRP